MRAMATKTTKTATCTKCGETKPEMEFYTSSKSNWCRKCLNDKSAKVYRTPSGRATSIKSGIKKAKQNDYINASAHLSRQSYKCQNDDCGSINDEPLDECNVCEESFCDECICQDVCVDCGAIT